MNPDAFAQRVRRDQNTWMKLIQERKLKMD
jgi:hypothetical protein